VQSGEIVAPDIPEQENIDLVVGTPIPLSLKRSTPARLRAR